MASVVTEADVFTATMTVPDDGDTQSAASVTAVGTGFQVAADRTRYLYNRHFDDVQVPLIEILNSSSRFTWDDGAFYWEQTSVADGGGLQFLVPDVPNAELVSITATFHGDLGGGGPHVAEPANLPSLVFGTRQGISVFGPTVATYVWVDVGTYDAVETLTISPGVQAMAKDKHMYVKFSGESGANSIAGALGLISIYATIQEA
jgi:hypothetical protein